jgi:hypothetical protein
MDVDAQSPRVFYQMNDAIAALSKHQHQVLGLFEARSAPARSADHHLPQRFWLTRLPVCCRPDSLLGWIRQTSQPRHWRTPAAAMGSGVKSRR